MRFPKKILLVDFDFTLVNYDLKNDSKLDLNNATLDYIVIQLCESYIKMGYVPLLFTARGLRSKSKIEKFLSNRLVFFKFGLYLGKTSHKFKVLKSILFFTNSSIVLIDDLSDYNDKTVTFIPYNLFSIIRPNKKLIYINPTKNEDN